MWKKDKNLMKIELLESCNLYGHTGQVGSGSKQSSSHSATMVEAMKSQLMNTTREFKGVLQTRQATMKMQRDRRGLFGQHRPSPLGK